MREVVKDDVLEAALDVYTNFTMDWDNAPVLSLMQFVTDMHYDALNRITELILPTDLDAERKKIRPAYNKAGALEKVDLYSTAGGGTTTNYVENITYNAKGQRLLIAFGNGIMTRYVYDPFTFRLIRQRSEKYARTQVGSTITYSYVTGKRQDDGFQYDLVGNIVKLLDRMKDCGIGGTPDTLDRTFEYDPLYRLTYADGRESSTQHENSYLYQDAPAPVDLTHVRAYSRRYSYDKLGNVLNVVQAGTNGFTRHYNYTPGKNTLDEINDGASSPVLIEDYTYDANGNQITAGASRYYSWNHSDQLICYKNQAGGTPTVYTQYDYAGQDRVSKLVRTGTSVSPIYERTVYIDGIFEYVKLKNTSSIYEKNYIHIMDDKSRIAEVRIGDVFPGDITDSVTFIIENQIGSSVMRTDGSGTEIDREEYYPFGDSSLRTFIYKRYRYVGKERDAESGLYYYGARYYAAWTCRFISVDPLARDYMYLTPYNANNNPVDDYDIDGMQDNQTAKDSTNTAPNDTTATNNVNKTDSLQTGTGQKADSAAKANTITPKVQMDKKSADKKTNTDNLQGSKLSFLKFNTAAPDKTRVDIGPAPVLDAPVQKDPRGNWPVDATNNGNQRGIVSGYVRNSSEKIHGGADIAFRPNPEAGGSVAGAPIYATHPGKVVTSQSNNATAGNWVVVENGNVRTRYLHMENTPLVNEGDSVRKGTQLGTVGNTGRSEAPHVHYEIQQKTNGQWSKINPFVGDQSRVKVFTDTVQLKNPMLFR